MNDEKRVLSSGCVIGPCSLSCAVSAITFSLLGAQLASELLFDIRPQAYEF